MTPNSPIPMEQKPTGSGLGIKDILFALYRRKWMVLFFSLLGFGAALALYLRQPPVYQSQAKLLVKYVIAHSNVDAWKSQAEAGGRSGDYITDAEIAILTSWDLARSIVDAVGVEHFVDADDTGEAPAEAEGGEDAGGAQDNPEVVAKDPDEEAADDGSGNDPRVVAAATRFVANLEVGAAKGSKVIEIRYRHRDPAIVQRVLKIYMDQYFDKHLAIYRPPRTDFAALKDEESALRLKMPGLHSSLRTLEEQLRETSRGDTTENLQQQRGEVQARLLQAEAELAQQKLLVEMLANGTAEKEKEAGEADADDAAPADPVLVLHPRVVQQYQDLLALERALLERKLALAGKFLPGAGALAPVEAQLAELQQERQALVTKHPGLEAAAVAKRVAAGGQLDLNTEATKLAGIESSMKIYQEQLGTLENRFFKLSELEAQIAAIQHEITEGTKEQEDLGERVKDAEKDQLIDHRNIPNIDIVQHPSDPVRTLDKAAMRPILGVAGAGLALGLGLAFLLEIVLNRRVKRPAEIESRLRMPLMLVVPRLRTAARALRLEYAEGKDAGQKNLPAPAAHRASRSSRQMLAYTEAIRDRLLYYFELQGMRHSPKLIALTGLSKGAGTSTLAAGVATAFAQADAKVLLVDLHSDQLGSEGLITANGNGEHPTSLGIGGDADMSFNTAGLNLSLATFGGRTSENGASSLAPRKFYQLMPKLRGSDFDYVIFDMPAIGPTSATSAMAGFMDKVVLVLDAENTDREDLKRGYADLARGKADVSCVFNKARRNAPRWLEG